MEHLLTQTDRAKRLAQLIQTTFGLAHPGDVPGKVGLSAMAWERLLALLGGDETALEAPGPVLQAVYRALAGVGLGDRYLAVMAGFSLPLSAAGVAWQRRLGPTTPEREAFHRALGKLRLDQVGLRLERRVTIGGEAVDWAIAGLLPTGQPLKLAIQVRPAPSHLEALEEDLVDDAVAQAGFEVLSFREWQLRYAGACALHVGAALKRQASFVPVPAKLLDPDDDHPIHRIQASPVVATPRASHPNWALRQALRETQPELGREALLAAYRNALLERSAASAEAEEWTLWG